jgi:hypothetical protein
MPALNARGIQELLPHIASLKGKLNIVKRREAMSTGQPHRAHHHLGGAFDFGKPGALEEVGVEQNTQHGADLVP